MHMHNSLSTISNSCVLAAQVKVKRRGDDQKFIAEVLAIGTECDIALLTVKDEGFWEGVHPLDFGPLPRLQVLHLVCFCCRIHMCWPAAQAHVCAFNLLSACANLHHLY